MADAPQVDPKQAAIINSLPSVMADNEQVVQQAGLPTGHLSEQVEPPTLSAEDLARLDREQQLQEKYGDSPLTAAALGAASGATFSLSDRALTKTGIFTKEELAEIRKRNKTADTLGATAGIAASLLIPGAGEANAAKGLAEAGQAARGALEVGQVAREANLGVKALTVAGKALAAPTRAIVQAGAGAEKVIASALSQTVAKGAAKSVIRKSVEKAASGAVEGGLFGLNDLLREDAIGEADLNAENLMASVGTGALYGGLIGGAIPVAGSLISGTGSAIANKAKPLFDKVLAKYADPAAAAQELTGFSLGKLAKLESNAGGKELLQNLPKWYSDEVGLSIGDGAEEILHKVNQTKRAAADGIEHTLNQVDGLAKTQILGKPGASTLRPDLLHGVADSVEAEFLKPYEDMKSLAGQNHKVSLLIDDIRTQANNGEPLTGRSLVELKRKVDKVAARFYERAPGSKPMISEVAAFKARDLLNKASLKYAEFVDPNLATNLATANRNYHYATTVEPYLLKKSLKDPSLIGFKDALFGTLGAVTGHSILGAAYVAGKKFMESDFRRKLLILGGMEKANLRVATDIGEAATGFLGKGVKSATKLASLGALINSPISLKRVASKQPEKPATRQVAYQNASENISRLLVHSDELLDRSVKAGAAVAYAAPKTAQLVGQRAISGLQFLQSKIPKRPYEAVFPSEDQKPYEPSSMQLAKFERYLQVVDNPMSVLGDLQKGTLTQEHIEALRVVYPNLYGRIKQEVLHNLSATPESQVPYSKKVQITILFGTPVDGSLTAKNIMGLQQQFADQKAAETTGSQGGQAQRNVSSKVDPSEAASRSASDSTAFLNRRNSK